ncbi:L-threonine 3-dehydrogenase-like [Corticium candelabrum]|uniref:L-threonine 3-dehydrogenase-like n=1 Tax=Corticium candelabrum TaxID=121492 RepID=UPI002E25BE36|nr:L-threonine 3-dehydrogenase-like [Corticium candelabrum]
MSRLLPQTMKALVKTDEKESYELKEIPVPQAQEGELLVRILKASICGSDIALYRWNEVAQIIAKVPFTPGHECVAEIVGVGPNCPPEFTVGKRVCCENHYYCGYCYQCSHDQRHICQNLSQYGHGKGTVHGACSQYSIIPARYAYLLKTDIDDNTACLLEPFGVAHQAVEGLFPSGETVLVQGCGPIGLFCIGICKTLKASKIIVTDVIDEKLEMARTMGADVVVNSKKEDLRTAVIRETNGDGAGRIVEATGYPPLVNNSFSLLRKGGRIVLIGLPKAPLHVDNVLSDIVFKSLTMTTVHGRKIFHTWEKSEEMLHQKKVDVSVAVTHEFPMSQFEKAFEVLFSGQACKIMLNPQA